jgi:hypothetical protein
MIGVLAAFTAMASARFRAAVPLFAPPDARFSWVLIAFDSSNEEEFRMRSPPLFAARFKCPTRLYVGGQENFSSTAHARLRAEPRQPGVTSRPSSSPATISR